MKYLICLLSLLFIFASQGPNDGATFSSDNSNGGADSWVNASRAVTSNNSYATCIMLIAETSEYLNATNFSFSSVTGTVDGIVVEIEKKASVLSAVQDLEVKLVIGGVVSGDNKISGTTWSNSDAYTTYGSSSDLWGLTPSAAQINGTDFGIVISCTCLLNATASIDHIRITVYYTASSGTRRRAISYGDGVVRDEIL